MRETHELRSGFSNTFPERNKAVKVGVFPATQMQISEDPISNARELAAEIRSIESKQCIKSNASGVRSHPLLGSTGKRCSPLCVSDDFRLARKTRTPYAGCQASSLPAYGCARTACSSGP